MNHKNIVWFDMETTGLNPKRDEILQVAIVLTDDNLNEIDYNEWTIHHDGLPVMEKVVFEMHYESELFDEVKRSTNSLEEVERDLCETILGIEGDRILAGNSIHFDRGFIKKYMPQFDKLLHYRMLDVSAIKIFGQLNGLNAPFKKNNPAHTALADTRSSIEQYKELVQLFLPPKGAVK